MGRKGARTGVLHHKAKLTEDQVRAIRQEYSEGDTSYWKLAMKYDVESAYTIYSIVKRITWKHL